MKMKFIIIILVCFCTNVFSQNRYSNMSTSTYSPMTPNVEYYNALAKQRQLNISANFETLDRLVSQSLENNTDTQFISDIREVKSYMKALESDMSLDNAEWYIKKASKLYNKAIKNFNKRIKKAKR